MATSFGTTSVLILSLALLPVTAFHSGNPGRPTCRRALQRCDAIGMANGDGPTKQLLEVWEAHNLAQDEDFWKDLNRMVYDGKVAPSDLLRFEEFCDNYRTNPEESITLSETGQIVCPIGNFPGLTAVPVHDKSNFDWVPEFEQRLGAIHSELRHFLMRSPASEVIARRPGAQSRVWQRRDRAGLHWAGQNFHSIKLAAGHTYSPASKSFPGTMKLLEDLDLIGDREVAFHRQQPHTGLQRHSDKVNYVLAGHIGIYLPDGGETCGIQVDDQDCRWHEDEVLIIDNSFPHHTWNDSEEERVIFYFDFFHPELSEEERRALTIFKDTWKKHTRRQSAVRQNSVSQLERLFAMTPTTQSMDGL